MNFRFLLPFLTCASILPAARAVAQESARELPRGYFSAPMTHKRVLAGTFGELREGHFHAGDDLKTQFVIGKEVLAPAQGYVYRASVSWGGYGRALYIRHPNGYTTVYGHLDRFAPRIDSLVRARQYERQSYAVDVVFDPQDIPVEKGERVAWSGNTGGSMGPHLHFEVRRTRDNMTMNPGLFGLAADDHRAPTVEGVYLMNTEGSDTMETLSDPRRIVFGKDGKSARITARGKVAFLIDAYDTMDDAPNHNGVYGIDLYVDGQKAYGMRMDGFYFEHTGLIDRHIAYDYYARKGKRLIKCFVEPFNTLTLYDTLTRVSPILDVRPGSQHHVRIEVSDLAGNLARREITVMGAQTPGGYTPRHTAQADEFDHLLPFSHDRHNRIRYGRFEADFPEGTFYKDLVFGFQAIDSMTFRLHNRLVPLRRAFTVRFDISHLPPELQEKAVVATPYRRRDGSTGYSYRGGTVEQGRLTLRTSAPGVFTVALDTLPPTIERGAWLPGKKLPGRYLRVYVRDGQTGMASFRVLVDGKWVLADYEYKRRELTLDTEREHIAPGSHTLRVEVTDGAGNTSVLQEHFIR